MVEKVTMVRVGEMEKGEKEEAMEIIIQMEEEVGQAIKNKQEEVIIATINKEEEVLSDQTVDLLMEEGVGQVVVVQMEEEMPLEDILEMEVDKEVVMVEEGDGLEIIVVV